PNTPKRRCLGRSARLLLEGVPDLRGVGSVGAGGLLLAVGVALHGLVGGGGVGAAQRDGSVVVASLGLDRLLIGHNGLLCRERSGAGPGFRRRQVSNAFSTPSSTGRPRAVAAM